MDLKDVLIFALRYAAAGVVSELDRNGIAPAPPAIRAFLCGVCRLLSQLEPDADDSNSYRGEDGN